MTKPVLIQTVPTWGLGPRDCNPKFKGGNPKLGIVRVSDRLRVIKGLSDKLVGEGVLECPLQTSFHAWHELQSDLEPYRVHNLPGAITYEMLRNGLRKNRYPMVNALTVPAFGPRKGVENGFILAKDTAVNEMARAVNIETIGRALELKRDGYGNGRGINWPAFDSWRADNVPADMVISNDRIPRTPEWKKYLDAMVDYLKTTGGTMHLEFKHGDPGIDLFCTVQLAIKFCQEMRRLLGRKAMLINLEFAHGLGTGMTVLACLKMIIEAELFDGFCHGNSGQMSGVNFHELLMQDIHPLDLPIIMDWDFRVGYGSPSVCEDIRQSIGLLKDWSRQTGEPIVFEHDLHFFATKPIDYFELSIRATSQMWTAA